MVMYKRKMMGQFLRDYEEILDRLYFLAGRGSWRNKLKYNIYYMGAILIPVMGVVGIILSTYLLFF